MKTGLTVNSIARPCIFLSILAANACLLSIRNVVCGQQIRSRTKLASQSAHQCVVGKLSGIQSLRME